MFRTNEERQALIACLRKDIAEHAIDGEVWTWLDVEKRTGISMSVTGAGRTLFRSAIKLEGRVYERISAVGGRWSSGASALSIVGDRFGRVGRSIQRAVTTASALVKLHNDIPSADRAKLDASISAGGAMRAIAKGEQAKLLPRAPPEEPKPKEAPEAPKTEEPKIAPVRNLKR
jgi:hypothetical protein